MNASGKKGIFFLLLVLLILSVFFYHNTITLFPAFLHSWTQSDRYALALGFLDNGFDLFHPQTFNQMTVNGVTRVDFPISEYFIAIIMKLSGSVAPVIFRMYTLLLSLTGLTFLYLLVRKITGSEIKAVLSACFVFLSPAYLYYQDGFIPTLPALSFTFIGYYYYFSYRESAVKKQFYISVFFFLLAALVRMPFVIIFASVLAQQCFLYLKERRVSRPEAITFIAGFGIFVSYFYYNVHLYRIYGTIFLDHLTFPKDFEELREVLSEMYHHWCFHYFTGWHYLFLALSALFSLIVFLKRRSFREENKKYWFQLLIVSGGTTVYFLAMAKQYYDHDYYFLDSFFTPLVLLFIFSIKNISIEKPAQKGIWVTAFLLFLVFAPRSATKVQEERYRTYEWDRVEITRQNFEGAKEFLDAQAIPADAKILVIDAYSYNVPLILMNRKGYTVHQTVRDNAAFSLFWAKWDYVVIQDRFLFSDVLKYYPVVSYVIEPVAWNGKITIYKRSSQFRKRPVFAMLEMDKKSSIYSEKLDFDQRKANEHFGDGPNIAYSSFFSSNASTLDSLAEFSATFNMKAAELKEKGVLSLTASADVLWKKNSDIRMIACIGNGKETKYYQAYNLADYYKPSSKKQNIQFYFALPQFKSDNDVLTVYIWNPGKGTMVYDNFTVSVYKNQ